MTISKLEDIKHVFYINLDRRSDRRSHCEAEFRRLNLTPTRFSAVSFTNGAIGCTLSHLTLLEMAKANKLPHILICEDDIQILNVEILKENFYKFVNSGIQWDVVLLGGNNYQPYQVVSPFAIKINNCSTTTAYLVQYQYYQKLIDNIREGLINLIRYPDRLTKYSIDAFWFRLQRRDNWYLLSPPVVTQLPGFSDILNTDADYTRFFTNQCKRIGFTNLD